MCRRVRIVGFRVALPFGGLASHTYTATPVERRQDRHGPEDAGQLTGRASGGALRPAMDTYRDSRQQAFALPQGCGLNTYVGEVEAHPLGDHLRIPYGNKEVAFALSARYRPAGCCAPRRVDLTAIRQRGWL